MNVHKNAKENTKSPTKAKQIQKCKTSKNRIKSYRTVQIHIKNHINNVYINHIEKTKKR